MNISFVLGHELPFPPEKGGGVNSLLMGLCKGLVDLGHNITAYSPSVVNVPNLEIRDGIKHVRVTSSQRLPNNYQNFLSGIPYALRVRKRMEECDVLSCHLWQGFLFSNNRKAKVVTHTIHRDPKKFLYLFSGMDRIYTGSNAITVDASNVVPSLTNKLKTVYNCVDFTNYPDPVTRKRDKFVRFLYVGRFTRDKGIESFIHAFCEAASRNRSLKFRTVGPITTELGGDTAFVKEMSAYVQSKGFNDQIEITPPIFDRDALDKLIKACDVVVLPSIGGETLNMSVLECMRLGKALLISDLAANSPLNVTGETGYFAKTGDVRSWEDKISTIASDIDQIEQFGYNAYRYAKEHFSCERIAADYIKDFEELIKSNVFCS